MLDVGKPAGRAIVVERGIRTVPAVVIDGKLRSLGVCTVGEATAMLAPQAAN